MKPKILVFSGSLRRGSFNKMLARVAARCLEGAGAQVTLVELSDFSMPLYDADLEISQGLPEGAKKLKRLMIDHDGFLISAPEYNSSIPGVLKNALDWVSRSEPGEPALTAYDSKTAALISASPGLLGGLRGLVVLRSMLGNLRVLVLPEQQAVPRANEAFDEAGNLKDPKMHELIDKIAKRLVFVTLKIKT